jgi:hypothetical protein
MALLWFFGKNPAYKSVGLSWLENKKARCEERAFLEEQSITEIIQLRNRFSYGYFSN